MNEGTFWKVTLIEPSLPPPIKSVMFFAFESAEAKPSSSALFSSGGVTLSMFPVMLPYQLKNHQPAPFCVSVASRLPSLPGAAVNHQDMQALSIL
jgi:hypothetical protein